MEKLYINIDKEKIPIYVAQTWKEKYQGLSFKKNINYGLIIPKCISIQTFFMNEKVDVIFFDKFKTILYIFRNVPKNKVIEVNEDIKNTSVLELPPNTSKNLTIGDTLAFEFEDVI